MMVRSNQQKIIDILLTLYAINFASKKDIKIGLLILQKVLFLSALELKNIGYLALGQAFYRWDYGPMSDEVYKDMEQLSSLGLIDETEGLKLTDNAGRVLDDCKEIFEDNKSFVNSIKKIALSVESIDELLEKVYDLTVYVEELDEEMRIRDIPEGTEMLTPLWKDEASKIFKLDPSWVATLDILLDPEADKAAFNALEKAKKGKFFTLEV